MYRNKVDKIFAPVRMWFVIFSALCFGGMQSACNGDDMDEGAMYTFTGETVTSFCQKDPELTNFYELMTRCNADALLEVYGHFTCFAPNNKAVEEYLAERGYDMSSVTEDVARKVVYNCVIREAAKEYLYDSFVAGSLSSTSMAERFLVISFESNKETNEMEIYVNEDSKIIRADQKVHNGVVHVVNKVIQPSEQTLLEVLREDGRFNIWATVYEASGWSKEMEALYDESYVNTFGTDLWDYNGWQFKVPTACRLGYTLFCEPDELMEKNGLAGESRESILAKVEQYARTYYGSDDLGNYTSKKNPLNRFVAYHMLNRQMATNAMVFDKSQLITPEWATSQAEYYETMYTYHLMEIKAGNKINMQKSGRYVGLDGNNSNIDAVNGFIHTLTSMLVYDENVMRNDVLHKRMRFDAFSLIPQFTNNNIRWNLWTVQGANGYTVTPEFCGEYFTYNDAGTCLLWGSEWWAAYQGDEINMKDGYDFTLRLLPLPPGNYELRIGYNAEGWRGMGQIYFDGNIAGTPVDLKIGNTENDPRSGWVKDSETSDNGIENDKMMRNLGYMKAPASCWCQNPSGVLRDFHRALRYIVGQYTFQEYGAHKLRVRNVDFSGREFSIDYFEFIPVDMIRDEDRG